MIPKECKRLAEVDFPIAVVSKYSAREKAIRHGHPSTVHLWWARRPLAACRAMLLGLLLPDPGDANCPEEIKEKIRHTLLQMHGRPHGWTGLLKTNDGLRKVLLQFIGDFSDWDRSSNQEYLEVVKKLVKAAHPDETPLVVDPFSGGGSIPLEALRLGCDTFASDLNPVACAILKVVLEDIPRFGLHLADELRRVGDEVDKRAQKELAVFYPKDSDGATPIAYLWARTVKCESPSCGGEIPLIRSMWICAKGSRQRALKPKVIRRKNDSPCVEFDVFTPQNDKDVPSGTVARAKATCICCGAVLLPERVRAQLSEQRGGADVLFDAKGNRTGGARMLAVVTLQSGMPGRNYRLPTKHDYQAIWKAQIQLKTILDKWERNGKKGLCPVPNEPLPPMGSLGFRVQRYGASTWGDVFSARQKIALHAYSEIIASLPDAPRSIGLVLGKLADLANSLCLWEPVAECPRQVMTQGRVKPPWNYAEGVPLSNSSASFSVCLDNHIAGISSISGLARNGQVSQEMAQKSPLPDGGASVWFTDPPYYDAIPYAELSDFFLSWLCRARRFDTTLVKPLDPSSTLSPKCPEIVSDETKTSLDGRRKGREYFEDEMAKAFHEGCRVINETGIGSVVFAHKTTEGWEALLSGMIRGGWTITGSWPIATEMAHRLRARDSAALATSVHLVCRPRPADAQVGDWSEVLRELPKRVGDWMERLQGEGVRGADLVFACIGPALEIFSRYRKVETADGREVKLAEYLTKVWEVVGRTALEQILGTAEARARNGAAGALEEDARLTALFLWTLQSTSGEAATRDHSDEYAEDDTESGDDEEVTPKAKAKGFSLVYDVARRFAQPLGVDLAKWEGRIIETEKGVVRLLAVSERAKQLFGNDGADTVATLLERDPEKNLQQLLFPELDQQQVPKIRGRGRERKAVVDVKDVDIQKRHEATTLDRVHAAMLLQASGQANALRALIKAEQARGPDFLRLANALSALYPATSEEKRLLDAMLLAIPR